jgi:hypothetical protein
MIDVRDDAEVPDPRLVDGRHAMNRRVTGRATMRTRR